LVLALIVRLAYLREAYRFTDFGLFYLDEEYHVEWAKALASGVWSPPYDALKGAAFFRAPLYPYLLAGLFKLLGPNLLLARVAQALVGSVSCVLSYTVSGRVFGRTVGLVTGVICSFYWVLVYHDGEFLLPNLLVFLALSGFLLAFLAAERRSAHLATLSGLAFGLFSITRPNILAFFPVAVWWMAAATRGAARRRAALLVALFSLGCLLPPAAVTLRNRVVAGDWVIVASQGGVNFYIGNNAVSNGMQAVVPGTRETWWGGYDDTVEIAEREAGRRLKASEVSDYWLRRGLEYIRDEPADWLRLTGRKIIALVGDPEIANNEPYESRRARFWALRLVPLSFGVLLGLFLASLPLMFRATAGTAERGGPPARGPRDGAALRRKFVILILGFLVVYGATIVAFFVTGRYRVPLAPFIAMGAALVLVTLFRLVRERRWARAGTLALSALALVGVLRVDFLSVREGTRGFAGFSEALDRLDIGDAGGAISILEPIRAERSVRAPELYKALVRAYIMRDAPGDRALILTTAEEGIDGYPEDAELLWYASVGNFEASRFDAALDRVNRYLAQKPEDMKALALAVGIALARGDDALALAFLTRAERIDPRHPLVVGMRDRMDAGR
jgi:4-amino-4-deoxy-L-arabinose transferase-like glycosyltransferase